MRTVTQAWMVSLAALPLALACNDVSWPNESAVTSLRVLGVRAEPASVQPGSRSRLSLLCADGAQADAHCDIEVGWFGDCNNPKNNDPIECLKHYAGWFQDSSKPLSDPAQGVAAEAFEISSEFEYQAPADVLRGQVSFAGQTIRYGTSYVFFAACAGQLYPATGLDDQLPVQCRDRTTGEVLGQKRSVVGVTTLYAYDKILNSNPTIAHPRFDGRAIPEQACSSDTDCGVGFACTSESTCIPVVPPCSKDVPYSCYWHCLDVEVPAPSFVLTALDGTPLPSPLKSLWFEYYANAGKTPDDAHFGLEPPNDGGLSVRSNCVLWQSPSQANEQSRMWLVLRDDRGGITWREQRVLVR